MHALDIPSFLGLLVVLLASAKLLGELAQRFGQPAVLGELLAGVLFSASVLGVLNPSDPNDGRSAVLQVFAEIGVILLLFQIGLETELGKLLRAGGASAAVAVVGVVLPFVLGYAVCRLLGLGERPAIFTGATLTATSVGITARVLSDLGCLRHAEGQIILGAAVLDDVLGLVILTIVGGLTEDRPVTLASVAWISAVAFGFLILTVLLGRLLVPSLFRLLRLWRPDTTVLLAVLLALSLAWLAHVAGSAVILGAFAAGLLLSGTESAAEIEHGLAPLGHIFVPLFFLMIGAAVDVSVFNPLVAANWRTLGIGALLIAAAVAGKFLAGYAPFWFRGRKALIGVGMIPRGEVGLIFAQMGLQQHVFDKTLFGAVTLMIFVTTTLAPPLLKRVAPRS